MNNRSNVIEFPTTELTKLEAALERAEAEVDALAPGDRVLIVQMINTTLTYAQMHGTARLDDWLQANLGLLDDEHAKAVLQIVIDAVAA